MNTILMRVIRSVWFVSVLLCFSASAYAQTYWRQPWQVKHCTGLGTRQFSSQLMNIPWGQDWQSACRTMPADINGQHFNAPTRCINNAGMWGEFDNVRDESCAPRWDAFVPGACVAGQRVYSARLWNITGDWAAACAATPAPIAGQVYSPPRLHCISRGAGGMWGEVNIPDGACADLTIRGKVSYEDGSPVPRLYTFGTVELWVCGTWVGPSCSWSKLDSSRTDGNGHFVFAVPGARDLEDRYVVRVVAENSAAYVYAQNTLNLFYADLGPEQVATSIKRELIFNRNFGNSGDDLYVGRHLNAAQKLLPARSLIDRFRDQSEVDTVGKVAVSPHTRTGTAFTNLGTIHINPNQLLSDTTLVHEYAHFAQESIGTYYLDPRSHSNCMISDPKYAWFEGFPKFFENAVQLFYPAAFLPPPVTAPTSISSFSASCAGISPADSVEGTVADILFLLINDSDGACGAGVNVICVEKVRSARASLIFGIFDNEFDYSKPGDKNIRQFRPAWIARGGARDYINKIYEKFGL